MILCNNGEAIKIVSDFCYLGSIKSNNCNYDREIRSKLAKANSTFGRLGKLWTNCHELSNTNKFELYEELVPSTLLRSSPQMTKKDTTHQLEGNGHR